jgi:hypothetical protein
MRSSPRAPVVCGTPAEQGDSGRVSSMRRGNGKAAVLTSDGGAAAGSGEGRRPGDGFHASGAPLRLPATLHRRRRSRGSSSRAIDDEVAAMANSGGGALQLATRGAN